MLALIATILKTVFPFVSLIVSFVLKIAWNAIVKMEERHDKLEDRIKELEEDNQKKEVRISVLEERIENLKERVDKNDKD